MADFKDRLLEERQQLEDRISKLEPFIGSEKFSEIDPEQQRLLREQLPVMKNYSEILDQRLALFLNLNKPQNS